MSSCGTGCELRIQRAAPGGSRGPTGTSREVSSTLHFQGREKGVAALRQTQFQKKRWFLRSLIAASCGAHGVLRRMISALCRARPRAVAVSPCRDTQALAAALLRGGRARYISLDVAPSPPGAEAKACLVHKACLWTN